MSKEKEELKTCYHWTEWERKAKELEKENAELKELKKKKEEIEKLKETFAYFERWRDEIGENMVSLLKKSIEHITNLEKENTDQKDQLAKAKQLLHGCIFKARGNANPTWSELITDIEQFLREIEK